MEKQLVLPGTISANSTKCVQSRPTCGYAFGDPLAVHTRSDRRREMKCQDVSDVPGFPMANVSFSPDLERPADSGEREKVSGISR